MLGDAGANLAGAVAGVALIVTPRHRRAADRADRRCRAHGLRRVPVDLGGDRPDRAAARARSHRPRRHPDGLSGVLPESAAFASVGASLPPARSLHSVTGLSVRMPAGETRFIFVTGGVVSALGKGIASASIGRLLVARGFRVQLQKFDPYINVDPGTMSPFQHGEVFVTEDGAETDLDLGHYERFTDHNTSRVLERLRRRDLQHRDPPRAPRRLPRRDRPGDPAHHRRDQAADPDRRRGAVGRLRDHRDRRHRRRHRVAPVPRGDPPALHRPRPEAVRCSCT